MPPQKHNQKHPHGHKNSGPREDQKGYSTSEAVIALKDELVEEIQTSREQKPEKDTAHRVIEFVTLLFVILTTVGVGIQDLILHSSDETFKETLKAQKKSSEQQLRAYVGVTPGDVEDFGVASKQRVHLIRKNYGTTPAYEVGFSSIGSFVVTPAGSPFDINHPGACAAPSVAGLVTMFPTVDLPLTINTTGAPATDQDIANVKAGKAQFVYFGNVCYRDAFGAIHYTNYCYMYKGASMTSKDADACLKYNDSN